MRPPNLTCLEETLYVVDSRIGLSKYDFDFTLHFDCRHPIYLDEPIQAVARLGAAPDYAARYEELAQLGITLVHTPEAYQRASLLPHWYPLIEEFTPESYWFDSPPSAEQIEALLPYPLFLKGERQTSRHARDQAIIETPEQLRRVLATWGADPILGWQRVVARRYLELRPVARDLGAGLPHVFEFRSFWWRGECVGIGPYWNTPRYTLTSREQDDALKLGAEVAARVAVTFLVIDLAQTRAGAWVVIECNDGQDSGYMGVDRVRLWRHILAIEQRSSTSQP